MARSKKTPTSERPVAEMPGQLRFDEFMVFPRTEGEEDQTGRERPVDEDGSRFDTAGKGQS